MAETFSGWTKCEDCGTYFPKEKIVCPHCEASGEEARGGPQGLEISVFDRIKGSESNQITLRTSSTNVATGATSTAATPIPPDMMELPEDERDLAAVKAMVGNDESLKTVEEELAKAVRKLLSFEAGAAYATKGPSITIMNITGPGARISIDSQDYSVNVANITPENVFSELRKAVSEQIDEAQERSKLVSKIQELEEAKGTSGFGKKYSEFIATAVNHMNLIMPFVPALTAFLSG